MGGALNRGSGTSLRRLNAALKSPSLGSVVLFGFVAEVMLRGGVLARRTPSTLLLYQVFRL